MDPMTRDLQEDGDDDEEEFMKKDGSSHKGSSGKGGDGKSGDKANMPRSKHSETEQRRRSKINERFQILRDLLPPSDQKRDKASFLLEVIEYVQFLHERLHKYETQHGGNQEPTKLAPWRYSYWTGEGMVENSRLVKNGPGSGIMFPGKASENNVSIMPAIPPNPIEPDQSMGGVFKPVDQHGLPSREMPPPSPLQPNVYTPVSTSDGIVQPLQRPISDDENMASLPPTQLCQNQPWTTDCPTNETLNQQEEMTMEGGTINIASVYSQGLLNNLTQALQSSGVDLSQASISVQIDLGKRAISRSTTTTSSAKDHGDPSTTNQAMRHSRNGSSGEDVDEAQKRQKIN